MTLEKNDIIIDGELTLCVYCVLGSVIYVKKVIDIKYSPSYDIKEVLKHYRKLEIIK